MYKYDLVIFDLDGTLADTSPGILNSIRYVQAKMGLPEITLAAMYSHVGPPMEESYHRNFALEGEALARAVALHKEYAMRQGYREICLYPGIVQTLQKLRACGLKTAVATLKAQSTAEKIFREYGLFGLFDFIAGTDSAAPKSKAQLISDCLAALHCEKERAVLVGDSAYDAVGAREAGVPFIAVTYGFGFKCADDVAEPFAAVAESAEKIADAVLQMDG